MNYWGLFLCLVFIPALLFLLAGITYISEKEDYHD